MRDPETGSVRVGGGAESSRKPWLIAPANTLSPQSRWLLFAFCSGLLLLWCSYRYRNMDPAWTLPDVLFYLDMAHGQYRRVPQPFTSRPLAPLLAAGTSYLTHATVETGFTALAVVSLLWTVGVVYCLLLRSSAPRWTLFAVACLPFWSQLLNYAGLPDPFYTALLAALLLALEYEHILLASCLFLPLMLARESTSLTLACFLFAGWRRLRWGGGLLAVACSVAGVLTVRHFSALGLSNPEHLSGVLYLVGKIVSNSLRTLGVMPWSNVYPFLCSTPAWQAALSLGGVRSVGVCSLDSVAPMQASWAFLTTFGVLPWLLVASLLRQRRASYSRLSFLDRFCLLYGGTSLLLAPALGTWYARLFAYAWPLLLIAAPRLSGAATKGMDEEPRRVLRNLNCTALLLVQICLCVIGVQTATLQRLLLVLLLQAMGFALIMVQRERPQRVRAEA